jgi:CelD/BcsL family acetyltransferase involved in cellulose biosynthesis
MNYSLNFQLPDQAFWRQYEKLWQKSMHPSPFQSPGILAYFAGRNPENLVVFTCEHKGELLGAALFRRDNKVLSFLSDMKTDANFFILHRDCTDDMVRKFFQHFLQALRKNKLAIMLNHKPAWAKYMPILEEVIRTASMYRLQLEYSVCPIAEAETPEALFKEVSSSRNTRYKVNKFQKLPEAGFEVLTDDSDMDQWVEDFCDAHVLRWAPTPTPSSYRFPARREFLKSCLRAWHKDGVLVRFAIKTGGKRIGLMAGLREGETLIYHAPTFHPDHSDCSPGRVLIYYITQWMAGEGLRILDFGDGNEPYKYYVASKDFVLKRIFISGKYNAPFIFRSQLIRRIRNNQGAYNIYQNKLKPALRNLKNRIFSPQRTTTYGIN